jgi:hypothetical protein
LRKQCVSKDEVGPFFETAASPASSETGWKCSASFQAVTKDRTSSVSVMAGLVPAIHVFLEIQEHVDARDKRGHDDWQDLDFIGCIPVRLSG